MGEFKKPIVFLAIGTIHASYFLDQKTFSSLYMLHIRKQKALLERGNDFDL